MENNGIQLSDFADKYYPIIKKIELFAIVLFFIGFLLYTLKIPDTGFILIIATIVTAIAFFAQAFRSIQIDSSESDNILGSRGLFLFLNKIYFYSLSISTLSLLGFVVDFQNSNMLLVIGGSTLLFALILSLFSKFKDKAEIFNLVYYLRILVCFALMGYLTYVKGFVI